MGAIARASQRKLEKDYFILFIFLLAKNIFCITGLIALSEACGP